MELAAAPPVGPAEDRVLLPAQLHYHQVSNIGVSGDEEGNSAVTVHYRPEGEQKSNVQRSDAQTGLSFLEGLKAHVCV